MKKILIALLFGLCCHAQQIPNPPCASDALLKNLLNENPSLRQYLDAVDKQMAEDRPQTRTSSTIPPGSITIPVVVYVVHEGTAAVNISDAQIADQLLALNNYFVNTGMKFCLATKGEGSSTGVPLANASDIQNTPGIVHVSNATLTNHYSETQQTELVATAHSSVARTKYLRIWVVKSIDGPGSGVLGYSMFPNTSSVFDGIVVRSNVFGYNNAGMLANYNQGKVLVHEVGHYLGLYHTFENSCDASIGDCRYDGDRVCDTPPVSVPNFSCSSGIDTCAGTPSGPDDIHNFMDYGDHICANHFTTGQIERMLSQINIFRSALVSQDNQVFTGTCGYQSLIASTISVSNFSPCTGAAVNFNVVSTTGATYAWDFGDAFASGTNPNTATANVTSHIFSSSANSPYTVTLTVSKVVNGELQTAISQQQIFVGACSPIINDGAYWFVSRYFGLDFKSGTAVFDASFPLSSLSQLSGNQQNDASGNLLFYSGKYKVWNKNHQQINTQDIIPANNWWPNSGMMITVPKPTPSGPQTQYYIFSNQYLHNHPDFPDDGFRYNIVNVSGTTATMGVQRQPIIVAPSHGFDTVAGGAMNGGSSVTAIAKCNGYDYWIITAGKKSAISYLVVFSLTSTGLEYVSEIELSTDLYGGQARFEASPNGNKLLAFDPYGQSYRLFDFNKADGILSDPVILPGIWVGQGTFSPDSQLLYFTDYHNRVILQYHINSVNIPDTRKVVFTTVQQPYDLQVGPDGKIYMTNHYFKDRLSVIHSPNARSTFDNPNACQFSENGPQASTGFVESRPNPIDAKLSTAYFPTNVAQTISVYVTGCNAYKFFPNICGNSFTWTFTNTTTGSSVISTQTDATHTFTQNGTYVVTLRDNNNVLLGTTTPIVVANAPNIPILGSTTACTSQPNTRITNNSVVLNGAETVQWAVTGGAGNITGLSNQSSVNITWATLPGTISLSVIDDNGCVTTVTKTITSQCSLGLGDFSRPEVVVVPNPSQGIFNISIGQYQGRIGLEVYDMSGRLVLWKNEDHFDSGTALDMAHFQSGVYLLKIVGDGFSVGRKLLKN
jgi:hypothetical protein